MKLFYMGRRREAHVGVGMRKYHFTAETGFAAEVPEDDARELLKTAEYIPGGTAGAQAARARAARILGQTKVNSEKGKVKNGGDAEKSPAPATSDD